MVESDQYDLVLTEDLGRIARRVHAHLLCELCVDHRVRLVALNDHVDTCEPGWEDRSIFSAWHHERANRDTSDRIKRTHRSRFEQGRCLPLLVFGYRKKGNGKCDDDVEKIPEAAPIYEEWFRRLDDGSSYSEVADWLNETGVSPGPYARNEEWDCQMVARTSHNWLLKGCRFRNKRKTRRNNTTGRYKSEKADSKDLLIRRVAHLAFFPAGYYDGVIAKVDARNAKYRRDGKGKPDPCQDRPKKRTRFPGQTIYCGICGRLYVFGGHGQRDHLMCEGAREYKCWNGITVDGPLAAKRISEAVFSEIQGLADFERVFLEIVGEEAGQFNAACDIRLQEVVRRLHAVQREIANVMEFIRKGDISERVRAELRRLEEEREKPLLCQKDELERLPSRRIVLPSIAEITDVAQVAFQALVAESFEFAKRVRELTGKIYVYPFRLCDGVPFVLRAKLRLQMADLVPDTPLREVLQWPGERVLKIDLFHMPERAALREKVIAGRQERDASGRKRTEREVADYLGITITAAQRAAVLDRLMKQRSLTDPYLLLLEPPNYPKLRRHLHPRYHFEPLPGHIPDW